MHPCPLFPWQTSFYDQPANPPEALPEVQAAASALDDLADIKIDAGDASDDGEFKTQVRRPYRRAVRGGSVGPGSRPVKRQEHGTGAFSRQARLPRPPTHPPRL